MNAKDLERIFVLFLNLCFACIFSYVKYIISLIFILLFNFYSFCNSYANVVCFLVLKKINIKGIRNKYIMQYKLYRVARSFRIFDSLGYVTK